MLQRTKKLLYFAVAWYFRIFTEIKLRRWKPRVIVVMGSSGKTTLLHMLQSQIGSLAKFSHHANSSIGIPFDILDIHRKTLTLSEWPAILIAAPFKAFSRIPKEKIYIVEADCDRPYEGDFLSSFLMPEVTLWTNVSKTHAMNFEKLVETGKYNKVTDAIAFEFGFFAQRTRSLVIANSASGLIRKELKRVECAVEEINIENIGLQYEVTKYGTVFTLGGEVFNFSYLLPMEASTLILMCQKMVRYLDIPFDRSFNNLVLPPGRNSYFEGIKKITIVDSTYNANLDSMTAILDMFGKINLDNKWAVLGDMLELGSFEQEEHQKLAHIILRNQYKRIILMGPRISKYTYPILRQELKKGTVLINFMNPDEVLKYLQVNIKGEEIILFKGARFLEGVIENLLKNKDDAKKLARRERAWELRRKKWGL